MSCRPEHHHRLSAIEVPDEVLHVGIGQFAEAELIDHQIRRGQQMHAWYIGLVVGIDDSVGILAEKHGALETMLLTEDFAHLRQTFLRTIFFIATQHDDRLPVGRSGFGFVGHPGTREGGQR